MYAANIFISKAIRTSREMITKRISGQQKQPGSFILQAEPLSRSYHVAESICRIYNKQFLIQQSVFFDLSKYEHPLQCGHVAQNTLANILCMYGASLAMGRTCPDIVGQTSP